MKIISLMYHDIVSLEDPDASGFPGKGPGIYKLAPEAFQYHLAAIAEKLEKPPITFDELNHNASITSNWQFTFDDGGIGAYKHTAKLLEHYGWCGHFFITTDYIGQPGFLNKQQIKELRVRGHVIGTHSCSHPDRISSCSPEYILDEWRKSIAILSDIIGEPVNAASIPGGFYAKHVAQCASKANIKVLFTSEPTKKIQIIDGCYVIGRYTIKQNTTPKAAAALASAQPVQCWSQWWSWNSKKFLKVILGNQYVQIRKFLLAKS